ncbi:MAG TPA: MFS transporter [Dongiaceae bacterium]|jgi:predicted MFS family arabinose efflux permease|nr:MFS transporter [Dongiaceae bacterium]
MFHRRITNTCFVLEGINSFASTCFFYYLPFLLRNEFGFGNRNNLWVTALHGFVYIFAAGYGGRFAQKYGYFTALRLGFAGMTVMMVAGSFFTHSLPGLLITLAIWTFLLCLTWPALEGLISEGADARTLPRRIGIYNVVWAATSALAYFVSGALLDKFGPKSLLLLPAVMFFVQFLVVAGWGREVRHTPAPAPAAPAAPHPDPVAYKQPVRPAIFLKMAWLGNPFGYIASYTLLTIMPQLAHRLGLSVTLAGLFCSTWLFARLATFFLLWFWTGWHYRFRWLLTAFVTLIAMFVVLAHAQNLWVLVLAQIGFGAALGLLYYSSLFYSMDVGETKGEHGGIHEAFIGAGIFAGAGVGATALQLSADRPDAGVLAVTALLLCGLGGLIGLRLKK